MTIINFQLTTEEADELRSFMKYLQWRIEDRLKDVHGTPDAILYEKHLEAKLASVASLQLELKDAIRIARQEGGEEE